MQFEPEAVLRIWAIDVDIAGTVHTIPPRPAADWLEVVTLGGVQDIVPGMLPDPTVLDDDIVDGRVPRGEVAAAGRAALAAASGTTWWSAARLGRGVLESWLAGELLLRRLDLTAMPFGGFLCAAYRMATRNLSDSSRARLDHELTKPPPGLKAREWWDPKQAERNFMAAMAVDAQTAG